MRKIIAIGGTGQLIAFHYLQLYLLGVVQEPFELVVIDTDDINKGLLRLGDYLDLLRTMEGRSTSFGFALPTLVTQKINVPDATAAESLSGLKNVPIDHPVRAFFDRESIQQPLKQGLYARPALSSVISRAQISDALLMPAKDSTTVAVGSIIGGTSGGLLEPMLDRMKVLSYMHEIKSRVRAVLFAQYFDPDEGRGIEAVRLQSNELLVMKTAREALDQLDLFCIVGGPNTPRMKRLTDREKEKNLPWPELEEHPVWNGITSLEFLSMDTVMPFRDRFEDREVTTFQKPFTLALARQRLTLAVCIVRALLNKKLLERMVLEPWLPAIWGKRLPALVSHYWRIAARAAGGWDRVESFAIDIQQAVEALWKGEGDDWGVGDVLPSVTTAHAVSPQRFSEVRWPEIDSRPITDSRLFLSAPETARRAAAVLLFWSLRTGV